MIQVGITGGMGSGKTTVCQLFAQLGIPVYDADAAAKRLMTEDTELKSRIIDLFGEEAYTAAGLNRALISKVAFSEPEKLDQLNALVHPAVANDTQKWAALQKSPYVLKEAALLYESGSFKSLDKIIVVTAPEGLRIDRVMARNHFTRAQVLERLKNQWPEEEKIKRADFVIQNDGHKALIPQVLEIHAALLRLAATS